MHPKTVPFCHSREGGKPVLPSNSGLPPEFIPAQAGEGVMTGEAFYETVKINQ